VQQQRTIVRFLWDCEELWHHRFPALHRRAQRHIVTHLCTAGRSGAAVGELSGLVKQVFLLDDATVRERVGEMAELGLCELDPPDPPLSARTVVLPSQSLLAEFDAYLRELASRLQNAAAIGSPRRVDAPLDAESRQVVLAAVERCRNHVVSALDRFFDQTGLSRARRLDARRHLLSASHWHLILIALGHRYGSPAIAEDGDGILADRMAAELLTLIRQNLQTTRDHIGYLMQLGLLERRPGRALRVALAETAGQQFDRALADAAEELSPPALAGAGRGEGAGDIELTALRHLAPTEQPPHQAAEHLLVIRRPGEPDREVSIGPEALVIGRAPGSTILLSAAEVSRMHCRIALADGKVTVTDLNSTNGTLLDGKPLDRTTALSPDSVLEVGPYRLEYRHLGAPDPEATVRARRDVHHIAAMRPRRHGT
jgi:FHA domain